MAIQANVGEPAEVRALAAAALDFGQGRLDFLVHSAAIGAFKPALQLRQNQFDLSMSVNARALLDLSRELLPGLRGRDARIIALTGRGSSRVLPDYAAVGASKAALEALVRYLAVALAPDGVRVNALGSGLVDTDAARAFPQAEQMKADAIARTPLGRLGTPEDIALAATLLCRAEARWITGQIIVADGGAALLV